MLGRFLEIGLPTPVIQESIAFYEALGFTQAVVGETWPWPYAVLTDGRLTIGLHGAALPGPRVTFVQPDLRRHVDDICSAGVELEHVQLAIDEYNQLSFTGAGNVTIHVVEARTYSPPHPQDVRESDCGYFAEWGWPVREFARLREFWEALGFVCMEPEAEPFSRLSVASSTFNLGFYRSRALRHPVLTFEDENMAARIERLRERGFSMSDEMPDALDEHANAVLVAPEGTRLLLLTTTR